MDFICFMNLEITLLPLFTISTLFIYFCGVGVGKGYDTLLLCEYCYFVYLHSKELLFDLFCDYSLEISLPFPQIFCFSVTFYPKIGFLRLMNLNTVFLLLLPFNTGMSNWYTTECQIKYYIQSRGPHLK